MDAKGSGDRRQVQVAEGRAVGGGPPSPASASATASSLLPSAPLATNATAQTRAGERASDEDEELAAPSDGHIDTAVPRLTPYAGAGAGADPPVPPAQIAASLDRTDPAIKKSTESMERDDDAPIPQAQTGADLEGTDAAIKGSSMLPPNAEKMAPPQMEMAVEENVGGTDPLASFFEEMVDVDKEYGSKKKGASTRKRRPKRMPSINEEEETLQRARDPSAPAVARAPSPPPVDQGRAIVPIPPPTTTLSPDEDSSSPSVEVSTPSGDPSAPTLEATLAPEILVYDGVPVAERSWMKKNKKYICAGLVGGLGVLIGGLVAARAVRSSNGARPSESSSASEGPPLPSNLVPSRSLAPSTSFRPTASLRPTQIPSPPPSPVQSTTPSLRPSLGPSRTLAPSTSLRPSWIPTAAPAPFCFSGEINIVTDAYPDETSWILVRIDTIGGVSSTTVVLEGSPEEEGNHTYEACLESGDYEFAIFDSARDGILSPGYYSVEFDGVTIARGGGFYDEDKVSFSLPLPSSRPPESSSPSRSSSPPPRPSASSPPSGSTSPSLRPSSSLSPSTYWSSLNWNRRGPGFNGDGPLDLFGQDVAFSADDSTVAVGAPGAWRNEDRLGYVKVYRREGEGSDWEQRGATIRGEAYGDYFGVAVALSEDGTVLAIGAALHDFAGSQSGQVKVYKWDEAGSDYKQIGDTLYGTVSGDQFGHSLDVTNDKILAVRADYSDVSGSNAGRVTVYAWDDASSNFKQRGQAIHGDAAADYFGFSVSLAENGQKLAVSAPLSDSNGSDSGVVKVFEWDEAASNYQQLGDSILGDAASDWFGWAMSFSSDGSTLAVGAAYNDDNGEDSGQVKVFAWNETASNFEQLGQSFYGKAPNDLFGWEVALSSEGRTLAIGACQPLRSGYVEVYGWDEAASEYKRLGRSLGGEAPDDWFGEALALAGDGRELAVGALYNDRNGTSSGRVEVFDIQL